MLIAQLSDTHCLAPGSAEGYHADNNRRLIEAVASLNSEDPAPEVVLGTGDLTNNGTDGDLGALLDALSGLRHRFLALGGNHDRSDALKAAFPDTPWADGDHASWVVDLGAVTVVGLDSVRPDLHGGEFDATRETWLRAALADARSPILLAMHHPPVATGIAWMDVTFVGLDRLAAVVAEHSTGRSRIAKIVVGHIHRPIASMFAGVPVQSCLSTATHVALDLAPDAPPQLVADPVGYQLHRWDGNDWMTHTRYIDTGAGAFVPEWAADAPAGDSTSASSG